MLLWNAPQAARSQCLQLRWSQKRGWNQRRKNEERNRQGCNSVQWSYEWCWYLESHQTTAAWFAPPLQWGKTLAKRSASEVFRHPHAYSAGHFALGGTNPCPARTQRTMDIYSAVHATRVTCTFIQIYSARCLYTPMGAWLLSVCARWNITAQCSKNAIAEVYFPALRRRKLGINKKWVLRGTSSATWLLRLARKFIILYCNIFLGKFQADFSLRSVVFDIYRGAPLDIDISYNLF